MYATRPHVARVFLAFSGVGSTFTDQEMEGLQYELVVKSRMSFINSTFIHHLSI